MGEKTSCFELAEWINWVGVVDWNIRDFHGYITRRGSTYNSYYHILYIDFFINFRTDLPVCFTYKIV